MVFGLFHGLVFLPVLLGIACSDNVREEDAASEATASSNGEDNEAFEKVAQLFISNRNVIKLLHELLPLEGFLTFSFVF